MNSSLNSLPTDSTIGASIRVRVARHRLERTNDPLIERKLSRRPACMHMHRSAKLISNKKKRRKRRSQNLPPCTPIPTPFPFIHISGFSNDPLDEERVRASIERVPDAAGELLERNGQVRPVQSNYNRGELGSWEDRGIPSRGGLEGEDLNRRQGLLMGEQ